MNEGRLPRPPAQPSARAREALARYDRDDQVPPWPHALTPEERWNRVALEYLVRILSKAELASYYAGVQARRARKG